MKKDTVINYIVFVGATALLCARVALWLSPVLLAVKLSPIYLSLFIPALLFDAMIREMGRQLGGMIRK